MEEDKKEKAMEEKNPEKWAKTYIKESLKAAEFKKEHARLMGNKEPKYLKRFVKAFLILYGSEINKASERFNVPPLLVLNTILAERLNMDTSIGDGPFTILREDRMERSEIFFRDLIGKDLSSKRSIGLAQIPAWVAEKRKLVPSAVQLNEDGSTSDVTLESQRNERINDISKELMDPVKNINASANYINQLINEDKGNHKNLVKYDLTKTGYHKEKRKRTVSFIMSAMHNDNTTNIKNLSVKSGEGQGDFGELTNDIVTEYVKVKENGDIIVPK